MTLHINFNSERCNVPNIYDSMEVTEFGKMNIIISVVLQQIFPPTLQHRYRLVSLFVQLKKVCTTALFVEFVLKMLKFLK